MDDNSFSNNNLPIVREGKYNNVLFKKKYDAKNYSAALTGEFNIN